jgi:ABC-type multidrug transport system ATPase subunit
LLGKRNSGCTSFLEMLVGNMKRIRGKITINGKISFLPEKLFFLKDTVKENIRFFNEKITNTEIEEIYN